MSNNKQSSVHIILNLLVEKGYAGLLDEDEIEEAKAMHKEEIKDAWDNAAIDATYGNKFSSSEQYYNETFGGEQ